jgi:signal transduction histidine kinase
MQSILPPRILLTDDNEENRYIVSRHLHRAGFEVWEAATGAETLRLALNHPSIILLDIKLPDINGFEVCRRIKSNPVTAATPVVHISATFQGLEHKVQGLEGGADGYITTPVEPEELIATVNAFLRIRQAETQAQQFQQRLSIAQKAARIGVFEWNLAEDQIAWTKEMELLYSLKPGVFKGTYEAWSALVYPEDLRRVQKAVTAAIEGTGDCQIEFRIVQPNDTVKWILARAEVIRDEDGKAVQFVGVNIDITDRKHDEEELREAQKQLRLYATELEKRVKERTARLEDTIQDLEAFSYSVSHDLRAPLRAMQGYSQYLLQECSDTLSADARSYLNRIFTAAGRLDQLVQDILWYNRIARAEIKLAPIDLERLIHDIIQQYPQFHSSKATIEIQTPLLGVMGSESYLTQCISNILGNAVKFVAVGTTPHIRIWTEPVDATVRLSFQDNGIGIAAEHRSRLFKMFERIHPDQTFEGTGIGLAIVKKAVERMGGGVGVESGLDNGSRFWIQLPRA